MGPERIAVYKPDNQQQIKLGQFKDFLTKFYTKN